MFLIYKPEGADPRQWTFAPDKLLSSEAEAIEKVTGTTYEEFGQALIKGSVRARRALLWVLLKRDEPTLRHSQVDPATGTMSVDYEPHELQAIRDKLADDTALPDEDRAAALAALDEMLAGAEVEEAPKAPGNDDASNDSGSLPTSSTSHQLRSAG